MCGLAGLVNIKRLEDKESLEKRFNKAYHYLKNRGPDEKGMWHDNNAFFLHTRLKILDLKKTSSQPMEYGNFVLSFNGEIYNFNELKNILIKKGYKFKSTGDTEVILAGWDYWGLEVLNKLDGMFAFALWDKETKTLYLARDRFGKKPLVYATSENSISFSSDIRGLKEIAYEGKVDELAIESLFRFRFIYEPLTIYENFKKLPAGSFLIFNSSGIKIKKWFTLNNKVSLTNHRDNEKEIFDLTIKAVEKRLVSDVPLGVFLSSGLDSGIISACLANLNKKIPHFTVGFENQGDYYDESHNAEQLAKYFGFEHHKLYLDAKQTQPIIEEIIDASDEPFADSSAIPMHMIAKETSRHIKVALSGDGGDEIFGGYRKYIAFRWNLLTSFIPDIFTKSLGSYLPNLKNSSFNENLRKLKRLLLNSDKSLKKMQVNFLDQLSNVEFENIYGLNKTNIEKKIDSNIEIHKDNLNEILARDLTFSLSGDMLVKVDRYSMQHSLEVRSPFLDKDLVDYAFSIPGKKKIGFFSGKKILRKSFSHILPKNYLNLPKKGFEVPLDKWLSNELRYLVDSSFSKKVFDSLGIKDTEVFDNWKNEFFHGKKDNSWKLWTLISYAKWAEKNKYI